MALYPFLHQLSRQALGQSHQNVCMSEVHQNSAETSLSLSDKNKLLVLGKIFTPTDGVGSSFRSSWGLGSWEAQATIWEHAALSSTLTVRLLSRGLCH